MARRSDDIRLLRDMAKRLREIALTDPTQMSEKVMEVAQEFEKQADALERKSTPKH